MSTTFAIINGRKEAKVLTVKNNTGYSPEKIYLTRFVGAKDTMLQISLSDSHIQLTKFQVKMLLKKLQVWETAKEI